MWVNDGGSVQNLSSNFIRINAEVQIPFLDFLGFADGFVEGLDASDPFFRLLEQTLSDVSHDSLVLSDFGGYAD